MVIKAADRAGIYIPRFCYHPQLSIAANCRMCLVEVAGAPKPLPACATPVTDGMQVQTQSALAKEAQQGTLEFLLINHPLDCPVCDQGGECPLQDQAMAYGDDDSRFRELKRAVPNPDIGPLIACEMTRCIHCTRCVRFGEEIAGVMELGMPGRGEHAYIDTFLSGTVDSEVSGNMIDLCPVGALTSRPYRFAARVWELQSHHGISPHDCVGANLHIQTLRGRVERVLPRENREVNEEWLADRDRYSYESVNSNARLQHPMIKQHGKWKKVSWETALKFTAAGLQKIITNHGGEALGALAGFTCTLEEYYLLQKLARALGCNNIDHRLQYGDARDDEIAAVLPGSEVAIAEFNNLRAALLVGSNLRKEQPLLALRLRQAAVKNNCAVHMLNPLNYEQNFAARNHMIAGAELPAALSHIAAAIARATEIKLPDEIAAWANLAGADEHIAAAIARNLIESADHGAIILGGIAAMHSDASVIRAMANWICKNAQCKLIILPPGNSAAAWWAGVLPRRGPGGEQLAAKTNGKTNRSGLDARAMFADRRRAYLLLATDPDLDGIHGNLARDALAAAEFVAKITAYQDAAADDYADVLLPQAAFTETAGGYINCEGRLQYSTAATNPLGESRPGWKILRVLANFLDAPGFDYVSLTDVRAEIPPLPKKLNWRMRKWNIPPPGPAATGGRRSGVLQRLIDMPMYRGDQIVRSAPALQQTADNIPPAAYMNSATIQQLGLTEGQTARVQCGDGEAKLPVRADARVPDDCVYIPAGHVETAALAAHGPVAIKNA